MEAMLCQKIITIGSRLCVTEFQPCNSYVYVAHVYSCSVQPLFVAKELQAHGKRHQDFFASSLIAFQSVFNGENPKQQLLLPAKLYFSTEFVLSLSISVNSGLFISLPARVHSHPLHLFLHNNGKKKKKKGFSEHYVLPTHKYFPQMCMLFIWHFVKERQFKRKEIACFTIKAL